MAGTEDGKIAPRYARALFELIPQDQLDGVEAVLAELVVAWKESIELRNAILNPGIAIEERAGVLREVVKSAPSAKELGNFLALLLENGRISALPDVYKAFAAEIAALKNVLALEITSALPVSDQEKEQILEKLKAECGSLVSIEWSEDKELIGGLLIKAGDRVLDNTVQGSLEKIRQTLSK